MTSQRKVHRKLFVLLIAVASLSFVGSSCSDKDRTVKQEMNEVSRDLNRGTSKAVREIKDQTCEMVNGKMECAAKKVKHSIQNITDDIEDAVE